MAQLHTRQKPFARLHLKMIFPKSPWVYLRIWGPSRGRIPGVVRTYVKGISHPVLYVLFLYAEKKVIVYLGLSLSIGVQSFLSHTTAPSVLL